MADYLHFLAALRRTRDDTGTATRFFTGVRRGNGIGVIFREGASESGHVYESKVESTLCSQPVGFPRCTSREKFGGRGGIPLRGSGVPHTTWRGRGHTREVLSLALARDSTSLES